MIVARFDGFIQGLERVQIWLKVFPLVRIRMLTEEQSKSANDILVRYLDSPLFIEDVTLDSERNKAIPVIKARLTQFLMGKVKLLDFKKSSEEFSRRFDLWGFKAFSGQMFFNMLYKSAEAQGMLQQLNLSLIDDLKKPSGIEEAKNKIRHFVKLVNDLKRGAKGNRKLIPNPTSTPYFLSYFWQIQDRDAFPVFYNTSMAKPMVSLELLQPNDDLGDYYESFFNLNLELKDIYANSYKAREVDLWFVEHVFWNYLQSQEEEQEVEPEKGVEQEATYADAQLRASLLEKVRKLTPKEFETLCVKLLQSMGYGDFSPDSGAVTGKPGDKGIDGVIMADRLGFDSVYIQAKRYDASQVINEDKIHNFVGAIDGQKGNRGVFITTSSFTKGAVDYARQRGSSIKVVLIDGEQLTRYMEESKLGVRVARTIERKQIDDVFFHGLSAHD